jgi:3-isopropylmalate/(R)-2-methylmalate dehydratase large subunit
MAKNIIEKIWDRHAEQKSPGHPYVLHIDKMLLHEVTSAQAFDELRARQLPVRYPERLLATLDHSIPTTRNRHQIKDINARIQVEQLRKNAAEFGITLYDFGSNHQGIVHVMGPELGFTLPGETVVCGDSHTSTHGSFGAMAFGVGTSEVGHVLATGAILQQKPKTMLIEFSGLLPAGTTAKDLVMKLIATIGVGGAKGHIVEFKGEAISQLSMEGRMTVCNMSIEFGARAGLIAPDDTTFAYLKGRHYAPKSDAWDQAVENWKNLASDAGCQYDKVVTIDLAELKPMVTWGINPEQAIAIDETIPALDDAQQAYDYTQLSPGQALAGVPIQRAFVGSCTNGRIEDLRAAAAVLKDRHIAQNVIFYVVPGSEQVREQAIAEGLDVIFTQAGADFRMPGCSKCLAMNEDKVPAGERCISSSNRNFIGRQGPGSITHLASPATVAASAVRGCISSAQEVMHASI